MHVGLCQGRTAPVKRLGTFGPHAILQMSDGAQSIDWSQRRRLHSSHHSSSRAVTKSDRFADVSKRLNTSEGCHSEAANVNTGSAQPLGEYIPHACHCNQDTFNIKFELLWLSDQHQHGETEICCEHAASVAPITVHSARLTPS